MRTTIILIPICILLFLCMMFGLMGGRDEHTTISMNEETIAAQYRLIDALNHQIKAQNHQIKAQNNYIDSLERVVYKKEKK